MGIDAVWKTESGEELGRVDDPKMVLAHLASAVDLRGTACLRFLDPYGDAMFNQSQLPTLVEELDAAVTRVRDPELKAQLRAVRALASRARDVHTYLWFLGD